MSDARFPIGKFHFDGQLSEAQRSSLINDIAGAPAAMRTARAKLAENEAALDVVFQAAADTTEEAILNSMFRAETVVGRDGNMRAALPLDVVEERLRRAGRL